MSARWLSIVGIGEDGREGLTSAARALIGQASLVVGGARHLALAAPFPGEARAWPSPIEGALDWLLAARGTPVCVLASGDPFCYGVGAMLARHVAADEITCLPQPSAFSLAAARLGWPLQDCRLISLHGRDFARLVPHLQPNARLVCLSWDGDTPARVAAHLAAAGMGGSRLVVLEAMGGPRERWHEGLAATFAPGAIGSLNVVAIEVAAEPGARVVPLAPGLPDAWFENDGQITRAPIRAMTLAALAPRQGEHLWDVGAGSGSVAIEWMLRDASLRATAIEPRADRAARIARNASALGVPGLAIAVGRAPDALRDLSPPDAVFVGGGGSDPALLDACWAALPAGGRLVVNAVTLETQAELIGRQGRHGGALHQIQLTVADAIGGFHGWRPAMPVTQWSVSKPARAS